MFHLWGEGVREKRRRGRRSFDFTGELREINDSGSSNRRSFVEQLENAFRTCLGVRVAVRVGRRKVRLMTTFRESWMCNCRVGLPRRRPPVLTPMQMKSTLPVPTAPTHCSSLLFPFLIVNPWSRIVDVKEPSGLLPASTSSSSSSWRTRSVVQVWRAA